MKLLIGLGNPGARYERTPHNLGFEVVERLAEQTGCQMRKKWFGDMRYADTFWEGERILLAQPLKFMNLSGGVVASLARRKGAQPGEIIVALDDADLPLGQIRVRASGRAGGHKGMQSIITSLGTDQVPRVRMGVGRRGQTEDLKTHVLSRFSGPDWRAAQDMIGRAAEAVLMIVSNGIEAAMNRFNAAPEQRAEQPPINDRV